MMKQRIALGIRYDGMAYRGWQAQEDGLATVQGFLEKALTSVANHPVKVHCAGRTDAGVHATAQVVHFDAEVERSDYSWVFGANSNLPADISVSWAQPVKESFHARFSATARRYRYILYNHDVRPGILRHGVGWHHRHLNAEAMHEGAQHLLGEHDFSSFRGAACQAKHAIREIQHLEVTRRGRMIVLDIQANAFLLHMVRNITGTLLAVGSGLREPVWVKDVLEARSRSQAGATISPRGLYLVKVAYPEEFALPVVPLGPFFLNT